MRGLGLFVVVASFVVPFADRNLQVRACLSLVLLVWFTLVRFKLEPSGGRGLLVVDVSKVVPSLWAPSREGCERRTSSAVQSGGECRRELADH